MSSNASPAVQSRRRRSRAIRQVVQGGLGFRVLGLRVKGFRVLGFGVKGLGFRVKGG